jgi:uncharacterized repeat protein (TIGR03803 family)
MTGRFRDAAIVVFAVASLSACSGAQSQVNPLSPIPQSITSMSYSTIYSFGKRSSDGDEPKASLIDMDGTLYGTTYAGGSLACSGGCGTVFRIKPSGKETVVHRFAGGTDGANPRASLLAVKGVLYGTTEYGGGAINVGTVFRIGTTGAESVVYSFGPIPDGQNPVASLIYVKDRLYGTTYAGGDDSVCFDGCGTVFRVGKSGKEKVLHSFSVYSDGALPLANLLDMHGTLYGTTESGVGVGGSGVGDGTVFSISTTGDEKVLYSLQDDNGAIPAAGLININGTLYGTTGYDGANSGGTAFSITTSGYLTSLHNFGSGSDGSHPYAPLLNVRGTLYGTTSAGGAYGKGTVFSMSLSGNETVLHSFGYGSDGAVPLAGLVNVKGTLYGTASAGGTYGDGTVFSLKP